MRLFKSPSRLRWLALALSAACTLAGAPVSAADATSPQSAKPAAKPPAKSSAKPPAKAASAPAREGSLGKGTGALLTRDELRLCMAEQDRLKQEGADTLQQQQTLAKERSEIDRLGVELKAEVATLDRTSQAAVDAFNVRAQEREKMIDAYQAATPAFNQRVDKLDGDKLGFTKSCGDRRYREDDFNAIKAGK